MSLSSPLITIGQDPVNNLVVDGPTVSDFHAEVTKAGDRLSIIDLLSAHGTYVNDHRISKSHELKAWDVIRLGTVELEVFDPNTIRPSDWALRASDGRSYPLGAKTLVGRDQSCDLVLALDKLSRRHAQFTVERDFVRVVDLGSANGTFVNDIRVAEEVARPGDQVRFGPEAFEVVGPQRSSADHDSTVIQSDTVAHNTHNADTELLGHRRRAVLEPESSTGARVALSGATIVVGRSPECDVVLADQSVSKTHAKLSCVADGWHIEDLGSSNGTTVNDVPVEHADLNAGDKVQLGRLAYHFLLE